MSATAPAGESNLEVITSDISSSSSATAPNTFMSLLLSEADADFKPGIENYPQM